MNKKKDLYSSSSILLRGGFIWNVGASVIYSGTSVILLWLTIRVCGTDAGGLFSIAFSSAQLFQAIGYFGVRNFQVSDTKPEFLFSTYFSSRICYVVLMLVVCFLYALGMGFKGEKLEVFFVFCLVKAVEAIADVFEGFMHQQNRLDMASRVWLIRSLAALIGFILILLATYSLPKASWAMLWGTVMATALGAVVLKARFEKISFSMDFSMFEKLTVQCVPIFLSSGMLLYLNNVARIAIDQNLDNEAQAKFGIVFMPAFVVNLLCGFLFRPLLGRMTLLYRENDNTEFIQLNQYMFYGIGAVSVFILAGGFFLGIPFLSWIYAETLEEYKIPLMIVLLGGSLCAFVNLLTQILTIMRKQYFMGIIYGSVCLFVLIISNYLTYSFGVVGASLVYLIGMAFSTLFLLTFYLKSLIK